MWKLCWTRQGVWLSLPWWETSCLGLARAAWWICVSQSSSSLCIKTLKMTKSFPYILPYLLVKVRCHNAINTLFTMAMNWPMGQSKLFWILDVPVKHGKGDLLPKQCPIKYDTLPTTQQSVQNELCIIQPHFSAGACTASPSVLCPIWLWTRLSCVLLTQRDEIHWLFSTGEQSTEITTTTSLVFFPPLL